MSRPTFFANPEFLFGTLEAARQTAETEAEAQVRVGVPETADVVVLLDHVVTSIEAFQAEFGEEG